MSGNGPSEVEVLGIIGRAQSMVTKLELMGVDVSSAMTFLAESRSRLKAGDNAVALEYAKQCVTEIVRLKRMADKGGPIAPRGPQGPPAAAPATAAATIPSARPVAAAAPPAARAGAVSAQAGTASATAAQATQAGGAGSGSGAGSTPELRDGYSYLFEEETSSRCYTALKGLIEDGAQAYCVVRKNPNMVRSEQGIEGGRIIWLTSSQPGDVDFIEPTLESLMYHMESFIDDNEKPVVFLDGVEYLVSENSFEAVMSFVRRMVDKVSEVGAVFIVVVSPMALGTTETKTLEREMTLVK